MQQQLFRSANHQLLGGICGGLGEYCGVDPLWFRVGFVIFGIFTLLLAIVVYLALWLFMPVQREAVVTEDQFKLLQRSRSNTKIAGVCGGLATYFGIDPIILRVVFVCGIFISGLTLFAYIVFWVLMPMAPMHFT